jgi:pimeloyl-ACP methyl ester carboxylesterase
MVALACGGALLVDGASPRSAPDEVTGRSGPPSAVAAQTWSAGSASSVASGARVPRFEPAACPTKPFPTTLPADARCGFLIVPENRAEPSGRTLRLTVGIVPAASKTPEPDPIVYLAGGPGGFPLGEAQSLIDAGFTRDRDLILMSQRGTLYAPPEPAPTCPELDRAATRGLGLPLDGARCRRLNVAAARACYQRLAATGTDLDAYDTTENAADFADLRVALGIAEWNVFGVSYGTNLAMTLMRQHPQGIRSVTLHSVEPPEAVTAGSFAPNAREGFDPPVPCLHGRIARMRAAPVLSTPPGVLGYGLALGAGCAEWVPYERG